MNFWERLAEQKLHRAIEDGLLEDLPGRGRPLDLPEDGLVPQEWRAAWHVLKTSGHLPDWLDLHKQVETRREVALEELRRAAREADDGEDARWARARQRFRREIEECNKLIDRANLRLEHSSLHRPRLNVERLVGVIWTETRPASAEPEPSDGPAAPFPP